MCILCIYQWKPAQKRFATGCQEAVEQGRLCTRSVLRFGAAGVAGNGCASFRWAVLVPV